MALAIIILALIGTTLAIAGRVLFPQIDSPGHVDAIVVVAGSSDDRYAYARFLAESGTADRVLVSRPTGNRAYFDEIDSYCAASPVRAPDGRDIEIECFTPDTNTTSGEVSATTRIAHENGWDSLLAVTYWGHVSRVRIYLQQCFSGDVYVTDTPRSTRISKRYALTHEIGGHVKAILQPAC
ncbi:hypothetical protein CEY15_04815 [Dietzia natronolimnaea]|uniref:DUF218 domain-containing protein n=1 Tax=Dietzia natronolimnaea TaxID=161920 RepID=A0A2A2WSY8_9ACTN|nr:hypothetical protein CEY15_04815 [Dietzia natronolimnaea]